MTKGFVVIFLMSAIFTVATLSQQLRPVAAGAATPTPTPPPASVVTQVCVPSQTDSVVAKWNFISPYLVCIVEDNYTGNGKAYKQNTDGTFSPLFHGGGDLTVARLVSAGVPNGTAKSLVAGLHP